MNRTGENWEQDTIARLRAEANSYKKAAATCKKEYSHYKSTKGANSAAAIHAYMNWRDYRALAAERLHDIAEFKAKHG